MDNHNLLEEICERGILNIAVSFSPPPEEGHTPEFYLDQKTGEPSGVVCELGKIMADDLSVRANWVNVPWPEQMDVLLDARVDLLVSYTITPERARHIEFVGPVLPSEIVLAHRSEIMVRSVQELNQSDKRIAVWHGSSVAEVAAAQLPNAVIVEYPDPTNAVEEGLVDACVIDGVTKIFMDNHPNLRLLRDDQQQMVILAQELGYCAIRPGNPRLYNWLSNWLAYHNLKGTLEYWCGTWWKSWMAD
jgi:ABC-type amino acid transport substrate-binding protein